MHSTKSGMIVLWLYGRPFSLSTSVADNSVRSKVSEYRLFGSDDIEPFQRYRWGRSQTVCRLLEDHGTQVDTINDQSFKAPTMASWRSVWYVAKTAMKDATSRVIAKNHLKNVTKSCLKLRSFVGLELEISVTDETADQKKTR